MELKAANTPRRTTAVPPGWSSKPIGQIGPLQRGFDLPNRDIRPGSIPIVYSNGADGFHCKAMAPGPGVVTGRSGTIGKVHFIESAFWPHNTSLWVTRFNGNDPKFVFYLYDFIGFDRFASGSGVPTLNRNDAHSFDVAIPDSPAEQQAIARALTDVDALLAGLDRLFAKKRDLKQAAMQQLLTGQARLPGFQGEWEVKRLGDLLRFQVGFPFSSVYFNEKGDGIRLVKNRDLKSDDQVFHYSGNFDSAFVVHDGNVLVGMDGDFLPCKWNKGLALLNQRVGRIVPRAGLHAEFAYYFLNEPLQEIENITSSTTVKHLSHGDVEGIERRLPRASEQAAIATVLSDMDAELTALEARRNKTRALKQGMMQELLTGRTRLV